MYEHGMGVKKDYATAAHWYEQAANAGEKRGQFHLGLLYEQGLGVDKNLEKASTLMRTSAKAGNQEAIQWLTTHHIGFEF
jgi:TPR repeat protein